MAIHYSRIRIRIPIKSLYIVAGTLVHGFLSFNHRSSSLDFSRLLNASSSHRSQISDDDNSSITNPNGDSHSIRS